MLTLAWIGTSWVAPALLARRALQRGRIAMERQRFRTARRQLTRAAGYSPLREDAVCLLAQVDLLDGKPSEALYLLNTFLMEQEDKPRSARIRLLRALAGMMLGRVSAARRELGAIPRSVASVDELLAAAQACVLCNDAAGAQQLFELLEAQGDRLGGPVLARIRLCRAAHYYRLSAWEKALRILPAPEDCTPEDARVSLEARRRLLERVAPHRPRAVEMAGMSA